MKCAYVNQDETRVRIKADIVEAINSLPDLELIEVAPDRLPEQYLKECDVMISHDTDILNLIRNPKRSVAIKKWAVIITCSSVGIPDFPIIHDVTIDNLSMKFYGVGIKSPAKEGFLKKDQWISLFSWATNMSGKEVANNKIVESMPYNVRQLLCHQSINNLIALSVLCQGYLAAHGDSVLSGWTSLLSEFQKKVIEKADATKEYKWWDVFESGELVSKIQQEWGNTLAEESSVYKLVSVLSKKESISELSLVKNAYMELSGKLRSSK